MGRAGGAGSVPSVIRTLLTRRWLAALAVAALFAGACVFLGRWQYGRHEGKAARAHQVETYYAATPVPLGQVLPDPGSQLPPNQQWRRVTMTGTYSPDEQLWVRNRPQNVVYGYEVLVPLRLADGSTILIDRGWVRNAERADVLPTVPPAPAGPVQVTGWLRPGEVAINSDLPTGQLGSIDLAQAGRELGTPLRPAYVVLESEVDGGGGTPARPTPLLPPETDTGPHFAYALQWWLAAPLGFVLVCVYARREWMDATGETVRRREAAAKRPKKTRIWDEEDA